MNWLSRLWSAISDKEESISHEHEHEEEEPIRVIVEHLFAEPLVIELEQLHRIAFYRIYVVSETPEGGIDLTNTFKIGIGETKKFEVHGFDDAGNDRGIDATAPAPVSADPTVMTVAYNGDGTGTITDVSKTIGATDKLTVDDGAGHTGEADGTVEAGALASLGFVFP